MLATIEQALGLPPLAGAGDPRSGRLTALSYARLAFAESGQQSSRARTGGKAGVLAGTSTQLERALTSSEARMRAVMMRQTGGPEVLLVEDLERPSPPRASADQGARGCREPDRLEVQARVRPEDAARDSRQRHLGEVEVSRAEGFVAGEEVFGFAGSGAYAEFATAPPQ